MTALFIVIYILMIITGVGAVLSFASAISQIIRAIPNTAWACVPYVGVCFQVQNYDQLVVSFFLMLLSFGYVIIVRKIKKEKARLES